MLIGSSIEGHDFSLLSSTWAVRGRDTYDWGKKKSGLPAPSMSGICAMPVRVPASPRRGPLPSFASGNQIVHSAPAWGSSLIPGKLDARGPWLISFTTGMGFSPFLDQFHNLGHLA